MKQSSRFALAVFIATAALFSANAAHAGDSPPACEIRQAKSQDTIRLSAVAIAGEAIRGAYHFTLEKRGPGGSSRQATSGALSLEAGGERLLSIQTFNLPDGATAKAQLVVTLPGHPPIRCTLTLQGAKSI